MPPNEDDSVKLAVAVNDITWIKQTMTETRDTVNDVRDYVKNQATKRDIEVLDVRLRRVEGQIKWIMGGLAFLGLAISVIIELIRAGVIK